MIEMIKRLLKFSGSKRNDLLASFVFSLLDSVFEMLPIMAILTVLSTLLTAAEGGAMMTATIWISLGIMVVSIAGRIFFNNLSCVKRTLGSFAMCAQKRLEIGEHMKRVPMGYFSENRLGEIAAAATTTLGDIENNAVIVLERVADGFIHAIVIGVWLLFYEWHIGLLMFAGLAVSMLVYAGIQRAAKRLSPRRQAAQANLVTCFLEYIQGMGVVKAFGLGERSGKAVNQAIRESAEANIALESTFSSLTGVYQTIFRVSRAAILVIASYLLLGGEITPVKCLLLLVSSFMIYSSVELVGSMASVARVIDASLDRMEAVMDTPVLDEHGSDITPKRFDIELQSSAMHQEYGKHDDVMRAASQHEEVSSYFKTDHRLVVVSDPHLALCASGTPAQLHKFISSLENGMYSRVAFYVGQAHWEYKSANPGKARLDMRAYFKGMGEELLRMFIFLSGSPTEVVFTEEQWKEHTERFRTYLREVVAEDDDSPGAIVLRHGLMMSRIAMVLTALRKCEPQWNTSEWECSDEDFHTAMQIVDVLLEHSLLLSTSMDDTAGRIRPVKAFFKLRPVLKKMPREFTYSELMAAANEAGLPTASVKRYLLRLVYYQIVEKEDGKYRKTGKSWLRKPPK